MPLIVMISHDKVSVFLIISTRYRLFPWQDLRQCREQLEMCKEQGKERTAAAVEKRLEDGGWHGETRRNTTKHAACPMSSMCSIVVI